MGHATTKPERALTLDDLPSRIADRLRERGVRFVYALKSAVKPNPTIPILWAVLTSDGLLLCTTHARRRIWESYTFAQINALQADDTSLTIISRDLDTPDLVLWLPEDTPRSWIDEFMGSFHASGGAT